MANETALTKIKITEADEKIKFVLNECDLVKVSQMQMLERAVTLSRGIAALKRVITKEIVEEVFLPLQGSPLGFKTDKDSTGGYEAVVVRNCLIQGFMWGLQPVNNELNIISGNAYAAKNGLERKVRQSVNDLIVRPGVPVMAGDKTALLPMRASWTFDGKRCELIKDSRKLEDGTVFDERYAIRVNAGMGPDAVIGKGFRKLYRDILEQITNGAFNYADGDVLEVSGESVGEPAPAPATPEYDGKRIPAGKKGNGSTQQENKPAAEPAKQPEPKSDPSSSAKSGHIFPSEIRDLKKLAQEEGNNELAELCELAQLGDAEAKAKVIAARDAMPQREVE